MPAYWWNMNCIQISNLINMALMTLALTERLHVAEEKALAVAQEAKSRAVELAEEMTVELRDEREKLKEALERQIRFVDMVSHEYRTPLAIVKTNLDLLRDRKEEGFDRTVPITLMQRAGARNYFVKPVECRELLAAITTLIPSEPVGQENPAGTRPGTGAWQLRRKSWQLMTPAGEAILLTSLELQLLELLAITPGRIISRNALLTGLYNRNDLHSGRALDSLIRRLRAKILDCGHPSPIKTAHAVGFCFSAPITLS